MPVLVLLLQVVRGWRNCPRALLQGLPLGCGVKGSFSSPLPLQFRKLPACVS